MAIKFDIEAGRFIFAESGHTVDLYDLEDRHTDRRAVLTAFYEDEDINIDCPDGVTRTFRWVQDDVQDGETTAKNYSDGEWYLKINKG